LYHIFLHGIVTKLMGGFNFRKAFYEIFESRSFEGEMYVEEKFVDLLKIIGFSKSEIIGIRNG
jgi:hypothetical protein